MYNCKIDCCSLANNKEILIIFQEAKYVIKSKRLHIHLIPKWRIFVTWPSMPRFCIALPRSSRASTILEFILFVHFIYFTT